jgi:hypothetical protein
MRFLLKPGKEDQNKHRINRIEWKETEKRNQWNRKEINNREISSLNWFCEENHDSS